MEATKKAQGDMARTLDSPANKLRSMTEQLQEIGITIGNILIPVMQQVLSVFKPILDAIAKMDKQTLTFWISLGLILATVGPIIGLISSLVTATGAFGAILGVTNFTALETVAIVVAMVSALVLLALIISVIIGRGSELNSTINTIGNNVGKVTGTVTVQELSLNSI